ncbi:ParA family protein (plasmid) [Chromobacterium amazonense]|uniref:ParA family protein n=1 Tax=Chromobacterium amazonense TaxID=1382803 RepID=UPI00237E1C8F|nr:ParA family protein [Chromobacterium amazonense]MDE1714301.1 ParA family protein [Chromobacterium amazonense]
MTVYALWNNKGGVGKSYLTFQLATEYARSHPDKKVLVLDLCPQANLSSMLLGGIIDGENRITELAEQAPPMTISGYIDDRTRSPYISPNTGARYLTHPNRLNRHIPDNLHLVCGDERLELQASRVSGATNTGPGDAWSIVHRWISDLINDIIVSWNHQEYTVFIDCNPSFTIYTELAMSASDRLIIPFSADGSSKRAVRAVLSLLYGINRARGGERSEFAVKTEQFRMSTPKIYCYVGNRLTTINRHAATAFKQVVNEIRDEIWNVWQQSPNNFCIHPVGTGVPSTRPAFTRMFQYEVVDANTASVVSGALGIPIMALTSRTYTLAGRSVTVNQSQLNKQQPNIVNLVQTIE